MAQLSYNTVFYDQLILRIKNFIIKYNNNNFSSYQELEKEYNNIVSDINKYSGSPMAKYDPYIKGEPAISDKFNNFISAVAKDLNIIAKQLDYQSAQIVSTYNLFNTELDKENAFVKRINSKISILQMYSNSPGNDLYYLGDSFDNFDFIDITKVNKNTVPDISGGSLKLGVRNVLKWNPSTVEIDQSYSNGFIGNNHLVYDADNIDENTRYFFEDNDKIGFILNVIDNSPLTYFDYESINIPTAQKDANGAKEYEFLYSKQITNNEGKQETVNISWADHPINTPLRLGIIISSPNPQKLNSIKITPNLGNEIYLNQDVKVVKVSAIESSTGNEIILNNSGFYIGSTIVPQTIESRRNYFYQSATINFPEVTTSKIIIYFEQSNYNNITAKHLYWRPTSQNPIFTNMNRLNLDALYGLGYDFIDTKAVNSLIPSVQQPNRFKIFRNNLSISVGANKTVAEKQYLIKFERETNGSDVTYYFSEQYPSAIDSLDQQYAATATPFTQDAIIASSSEDAAKLKEFIEIQTGQKPSNQNVQRIYQWDPNKFKNLTVQEIDSYSTIFPEPISIQLQRRYETYAAKRWSISIKSIDCYYNVYNNTASIVSKPFEFPYNIKNLSLSSEVSSVSNSISSDSIKYYISVDDANSWIQISPVENQFMNIPEILSFNENVYGNTQLPGVSYFNYPKIPKEIKKIRVKIDISRSSTGLKSNNTPVLYSYKLCAKVEQI